MRLFLSIFLLFTMLSSVTVTLVQQFQTSSICEFKESKTDDDNTEDTDEKESKTEKDLFAYKSTLHNYSDNGIIALSVSKIHGYYEELISSLYIFLPYNPPEN